MHETGLKLILLFMFAAILSAMKGWRKIEHHLNARKNLLIVYLEVDTCKLRDGKAKHFQKGNDRIGC